MAAALDLADKLCVNDFIVVALGLNDGAEVHNRLTALAIGTAFVAVLGAGSFLAQNSQLCIVLMVGRRNGGQLGIHIDAAGERAAVDNAVNHIALDVDHRLVAHVGRRIGSIGNIVVTVKHPNANRNADQGVACGSCAHSAVSFNCDRQQLGDLIVVEGSLEAGGNDGTLGFPGVGIVQLQDRNQLLGVGQIGNIDVHIVDRLCLGGLAGVIVAVQDDSGITFDDEGAGQTGGIAQLVLDLESHSVGAGVQLNIFLGGQHSARNGRFHFHTVHKDLTGGQIQRSIVSYGCGEGEVSTGINLAVFQRHSSISGGVGGIGDGGQDSVIHSGGVIQGDVVDVESQLSGGSGLDVSTNERGRTGISLISCVRHAQIIVLGNIDGHIDPAGFRNISLSGRVQVGLIAGSGGGEHEVILLAGVGTAFCGDVQLGLEGQTGSAHRNVDPHAQGSSLLAVGNVAQNDGVAGVEQHIVRPVCKRSIAVIQSPCQSVVAVANLAAIGCSRNKGGAAQVFVELTGQRLGTNQRVVDAVVLAPLLGLFEAHEAGLVAVFKVKDDFGALAELDGVDQLDFAIGNGHIHACDGSIVGGGELKAIQRTCCIVGKRNRNCIGVHIDIGLTGHSHDGQGDGADLFGSGVRNNRRGCRQLKDRGVSNGDGLGADHLAAGKDLHFHSALFAVGNELAVNNGAEGIIGQCPTCVSGHLHGIAMGVDGLCGEVVNGLGSKNVIVSFNIDIVQNAGGSNIGNDEDAVCGGTLCAVTGNGAHLEVLFANTLGDEGGGAAAVTVGSPLTAKSQHSFALFIGAEANGVVGATAIIHDQDQRTVFLNTDHGTGSVIVAALLSGIDQSAVLNDHTEGDTNRMEQDAFFQVLVNISFVECLDIAGDVALSILEDIQDGGGVAQSSTTGSNIFACIADPFAVVDQNTGGVRAIIQVGVHTADDVVSEVLLVILGHLGQFLVRPVGLVFQILIDLVVSGNDGYIGVGRVDLDNVEDLSAGAGCVVEHDFGLNGCAGDENVILFGDYVVVAVCAERCAVENNVILFPV